MESDKDAGGKTIPELGGLNGVGLHCTIKKMQKTVLMGGTKPAAVMSKDKLASLQLKKL